MDRTYASKLLRSELDKHSLQEWHVKVTTNINQSFLALCVYKDKTIILNGHHVDLHPEAEVINTIKHEVAHALTPGNGHNDIWAAKAREIGCDNTLPCSHLTLPEHVIDAIRSGHMVELIVEEETHVIRRPKYVVTQLKDVCPECGKVAKEKFSINVVDKEGNDVKLITLECFHIIKRVVPKGTPFDSMVSNDWKPEIKSCKHAWNKNQCNECGEYKLFNFQVVGAQNVEAGLAQQKGYGVFDDMGLGKTVQALAIIKFHKEYTPTLYVVKSGIKFQFYKQIIRWLGPEYLAQVISTGKDYIFPGLKSYIISFSLLGKMKDKIKELGIKCVIVDECQQISNPDSTRTQALRNILSDQTIKVIPLSGTPWKNRGSEFFPVLNMIDPIKFHSNQRFLDQWVDYYYEGNRRKMGGIRQPAKFKEYTANLLIRREFNEVMDEFPDINRMKLPVQLDEFNQKIYDTEVSEFVKWYNEAVIGGEEDSLNGMEILAKLSRMRHITGLAKIPATLGFIEEFVEDTDKKLVVFVHHKDVGQLMLNALTVTDDSNKDWKDLAISLREGNIKVMKLGAEFSDSERFAIQEEFNNTPRCIMIASTLAAGEGIDLQTCADSVMHERQWNPQNEDQAAPGRFRRIGQKSKVINVTFAEAEGTVDEHLDSLVETKRRNFHAAMNKSEGIRWNDSDLAKNLAEIIVRKHKEKFGTKSTDSKSITGQTSYGKVR